MNLIDLLLDIIDWSSFLPSKRWKKKRKRSLENPLPYLQDQAELSLSLSNGSGIEAKKNLIKRANADPLIHKVIIESAIHAFSESLLYIDNRQAIINSICPQIHTHLYNRIIKASELSDLKKVLRKLMKRDEHLHRSLIEFILDRVIKDSSDCHEKGNHLRSTLEP